MRSKLQSGAAASLLAVASVHGASSAAGQAVAPAYPTKDFVARVLGSTEDVWDELFKMMGRSPYPRPWVVLYSGETHSACGPVSAAVGPTYCPADRKVYVDPAFVSGLSARSGATPSDFSVAYMIVNEISRHVQNVLGTVSKVNEQMRETDARGRNALSVRLELQADCYTGVWAYFLKKRNQLNPGDLEQGVPALKTPGDGSVRASADKRLEWFERGFATGDPQRCDTFTVANL